MNSRCIMEAMLSLVLLGMLCTATYAATTTEDVQEVEMKLYQVNEDDWKNKGEAIFKKYLIEEANTYCEDKLDSCQFGSWKDTDKFVSTGYEQVEGYPKKEKSFLLVQFSLKLPTGADMKSNAPRTYLNRDALAVIAANSRDKFRDDTDWSIVNIDGQKYELPPDNTLNIAISVAGCVLLLILIIALVIMQHRCGKRKSLDDKNDGATETIA